MSNRRSKILGLGTPRPQDDFSRRIVTRSPFPYSKDQSDEGTNLFMQTADGSVKTVELKTYKGISLSQLKSTEPSQPYSEALAKYIIEQERRGNKFFIQIPGGTVKRFSVARNPTKHISDRI